MVKELRQSDLEFVTNGSSFDYKLMKNHIRGRPEPTEKYTTEELEAMNIVGWYQKKA